MQDSYFLSVTALPASFVSHGAVVGRCLVIAVRRRIEIWDEEFRRPSSIEFPDVITSLASIGDKRFAATFTSGALKCFEIHYKVPRLVGEVDLSHLCSYRSQFSYALSCFSSQTLIIHANFGQLILVKTSEAAPQIHLIARLPADSHSLRAVGFWGSDCVLFVPSVGEKAGKVLFAEIGKKGILNDFPDLTEFSEHVLDFAVSDPSRDKPRVLVTLHPSAIAFSVRANNFSREAIVGVAPLGDRPVIKILPSLNFQARALIRSSETGDIILAAWRGGTHAFATALGESIPGHVPFILSFAENKIVIGGGRAAVAEVGAQSGIIGQLSSSNFSSETVFLSEWKEFPGRRAPILCLASSDNSIAAVAGGELKFWRCGRRTDVSGYWCLPGAEGVWALPRKRLAVASATSSCIFNENAEIEKQFLDECRSLLISEDSTGRTIRVTERFVCLEDTIIWTGDVTLALFIDQVILIAFKNSITTLSLERKIGNFNVSGSATAIAACSGVIAVACWQEDSTTAIILLNDKGEELGQLIAWDGVIIEGLELVEISRSKKQGIDFLVLVGFADGRFAVLTFSKMNELKILHNPIFLGTSSVRFSKGVEGVLATCDRPHLFEAGNFSDLRKALVPLSINGPLFRSSYQEGRWIGLGESGEISIDLKISEMSQVIESNIVMHSASKIAYCNRFYVAGSDKGDLWIIDSERFFVIQSIKLEGSITSISPLSLSLEVNGLAVGKSNGVVDFFIEKNGEYVPTTSYTSDLTGSVSSLCQCAPDLIAVGVLNSVSLHSISDSQVQRVWSFERNYLAVCIGMLNDGIIGVCDLMRGVSLVKGGRRGGSELARDEHTPGLSVCADFSGSRAFIADDDGRLYVQTIDQANNVITIAALLTNERINAITQVGKRTAYGTASGALSFLHEFQDAELFEKLSILMDAVSESLVLKTSYEDCSGRWGANALPIIDGDLILRLKELPEDNLKVISNKTGLNSREIMHIFDYVLDKSDSHNFALDSAYTIIDL